VDSHSQALRLAKGKDLLFNQCSTMRPLQSGHRVDPFNGDMRDCRNSEPAQILFVQVCGREPLRQSVIAVTS